MELSTQGMETALKVWDKTLLRCNVFSDKFEEQYKQNAQVFFGVPKETVDVMYRVALKFHS